MAKGSSNERKKCKEWSLWFSQGERDDIWWRDNSGARATTRAKKGRTTANAYGDMVLKDPIGEPYSRICTNEFKKGYNKTFDFFAIVDGRGSKKKLKFIEFWNQVKQDAENAAEAGWGSEPILVVHRDRMKPVIAMRSPFFHEIEDFCGLLPKDVDLLVWQNRKEGEKIILFALEAFFRWASPDFFRQRFNQTRGQENAIRCGRDVSERVDLPEDLER